MERQERHIYLLTSDKEADVVRDGVFSKEIARIHGEEGLDALFFSSDRYHPLLEDHCQDNSIEVCSLDGDDDPLSSILEYSDQNPQNDRLAYISEQSSLNGLAESLQEEDFEVERLALSS